MLKRVFIVGAILAGILAASPLAAETAREADIRASEGLLRMDPYSRQDLINKIEIELSVKYGTHLNVNVLQVTKRGKYFTWCGAGDLHDGDELVSFILTDNPAVKSNIHVDMSSGEFEHKGCYDADLTVRLR